MSDIFLFDEHCVKCRNYTQFPGVEILWKGTVSAKFRAIHPKLCGECAFPQIFHTRTLDETAAFDAVEYTDVTCDADNNTTNISCDSAYDVIKTLQ